MKRKDLFTLIFVALVSGLISLVVSGSIFTSGQDKESSPVVEKIEPAFPDIANDSDYNKFLNNKALDPTQPVKIGDNQNKAPFTQ